MREGHIFVQDADSVYLTCRREVAKDSGKRTDDVAWYKAGQSRPYCTVRSPGPCQLHPGKQNNLLMSFQAAEITSGEYSCGSEENRDEKATTVYVHFKSKKVFVILRFRLKNILF